jgi:hypothetical protein
VHTLAIAIKPHLGASRRRSVRALALGACFWLTAAFLSTPAVALTYPWVFLNPENDSRDSEMRELDEAESSNMVGVINGAEDLFGHHLVWKKSSIRNLLSLNAPFCEMRFDAVHPFWLTPDEKSILTEYLKRGGFILFFIDTYPYAQDEFWKIKQWPLIDFLTKELPASDSGFTTGKATDDFAVFKAHYHTETADFIRHELTGNPNTPNRTLLFYQGRLCSFVMGRYGYIEDGKWVAASRPLPKDFSMDLKSYRLIVNIYTYSIVK